MYLYGTILPMTSLIGAGEKRKDWASTAATTLTAGSYALVLGVDEGRRRKQPLM